MLFERVAAHASPAQWSEPYVAPENRLVLPGAGAVQFGVAQQSIFLDGITALHVGQGTHYQLRPEPGAGDRTSVVLSTQAAPGDPACARSWLLSASTLYRLQLAWLRLERGEWSAADTAREVRQLLRASPVRPAAKTPPAVDRARRFLAAQSHGSHCLEEIADQARISAFHLARSFARHAGLSLHAYRTRLRLAQAIRRLQDGERDLAGLAVDLGFGSQSHFGEVFRTQVGVTPGQARAALTRTSAGI